MPAATDEQRAARVMSEAELFKGVAEALKKFGWRYFHIPATAYRHGVRAGFPDLVMVKGERLIFAELKRQKEQLSDEQVHWAEDLANVHQKAIWSDGPPGFVRYLVWRPSNLLSGEIADILAGGVALDPIAGSYAGTYADWEGKADIPLDIPPAPVGSG